MDALPSAVLVKQATASPPPLFQLCKNIPRPLALAVHSLLAKRADDRPRTAADARRLLAHSLVRPDRDPPEADPLSSTVATVGARANLLLRAAAPIGIVFAFGALLFVWANRGETADIAAESAQTHAVVRDEPSRSGESKTVAKTDNDVPPTKTDSQVFSGERARQIATSLTTGTISAIQVVQTRSGQAMVALSENGKKGGAHYVLLERRDDAFHVATRGSLETKAFKHATWTSERIDVNDDGFDEVLFTGTRAHSFSGYRLVLYSPKSRQVFSLEVETKGKSPVRALWSENLMKGNGSVYRRLLTKRANQMLVKTKIP
jgi:hypothetical protein